MAYYRDTALPALNSTDWYAWSQAVDLSLRNIDREGIWMDSFTGTDDQRINAALAEQNSNTGDNRPPVILPCRPMTWTTPKTLFSGMTIIGARNSGQKNPELASGTYMSAPEITLGGSVSSGTSSLFNSPGSACYDIFMSDFAVQGSAGASTHQFLDFPTPATLYACEFRSLSFNFMRSVFGRKDRICAFTQVNLSGVWTMNNLWDTQMALGGSDNSLFMHGYVNIGPSGSAAQTGSYANSSYEILMSSLSNTDVGYIYASMLNGWRGLRVTGASSSLNFFGGVYEGYKSTRQNGLLSGPAPGTTVRLDNGSGNFYGTFIGQGMDNPDAAENGLVQVNGGEWNFFGPNFYGANMATANAIDHRGGRVLVMGATKRQNEAGTWSNRPNYSTASSGPNATSKSFYNPDLSMVAN